MKLVLITLFGTLFLSSCVTTQNRFYNCQGNLCELLLAQVEEGFPIYDEHINTGNILKPELKRDSVIIIQSGDIFKLGNKNDNCMDQIKYLCNNNTNCQFVATGKRVCTID